jgi:outer membrane protein insertion porin family
MRRILLVVCLLFVALALHAQQEWYLDKPISDFVFKGLVNVNENEVRPLVAPYVGKNFSLDLFWEIQEKLYALDYFESIEANALPGNAEKTTVIVEFTVREKPTVAEIVLEGNRRLRRGEILEKVLLKTGDVVTQTQANLDAQAISDLYREKGYTDAAVSARLQPAQAENTVDVVFTISEGVQTTIRSINFSGNVFASESTLRKQMKTKPQSLFSAGVFQEAKFEDDLQSILDYYGERGYIDARIEKVDRTVETDQEQEGKAFLVITIYIDEGKQWTYGGMSFEGNHIFSEATLSALVRQTPGKTLNKTRLEADTQRVADLYYENGYIFNTITRDERRDEKKQEIFYTLHIVEKDRAHIESIIIKGNTRTKDYVILRELPFEVGDVFNKTKVLQGLRNLYNLQYFTSIQPETLPGSAEGLMDLVINVEEGSTANINFGVQFAGGDYPVSGMLKWEESNFLGRGQQLSVNSELSTGRQLLSLSFQEPWLFGERWLGGTSFSFEHSIVPNIPTDELYPIFEGSETNAFPDPYLTYEDYQAALDAGTSIPSQFLMEYTLWKLSLGVNSGYRYFTPAGWLGVRGGLSTSLEQVAYDATVDRPFDPVLREGNHLWKNVNKLGITLYWDDRDYFLNPTQGFYLAQGATFAMGFPLGTRQYIRTDSTAEGFLKLFNIPVTDNWNFEMVLAAHSSLSLILPYGNTDLIAITSDLLYVDGWNVAPGWPLEQDMRVLWDNRLELRLPIAEQALWWSFFFDAVAAYPELSGLADLNSDDFLFSFGGGLRFTIPQFPIRLYLAKRFKTEAGKVQWQEGDLSIFGLSLDFVISLGGDTF